MKTRIDIITESVDALKACYNHYADEPINEGLLIKLKIEMNDRLPNNIPTKEWGKADCNLNVG